MKKQYLTIITVLIIALGAGVFVWQKQRNQVQEQPKQEEVVKADVSTDIDTSDWKTYRNEEYGYSIDYPRSWFVEETEAANKDPYLRGGDEIGGDIYISNYSAPSKYSLGDVPADIFSVSLMVYRVDSSITYDEFIKQRNYEFNPEHGDSKTELMLNGNKVMQLRMKTTDHPVGLDVVITLVHDSDKMFVLNYSTNERPSGNMKDFAKKIIESFSLGGKKK